MNIKLNLFEQLVLWLSRNKRSSAIYHDNYNNRTYVQGSVKFIELDNELVMVVGREFCYKATSLAELIKFVEGIN